MGSVTRRFTTGEAGTAGWRLGTFGGSASSRARTRSSRSSWPKRCSISSRLRSSPGENGKPAGAEGGGERDAGEDRDLGATGVRADGPVAHGDALRGLAGDGERRGAKPHDRPGCGTASVRLSPDPRDAAPGGPAGEREARVPALPPRAPAGAATA